MTVQDLLSKAQVALKNADVSTARLDCLVLLEDATNKDRSWLLAHPEFKCQDPTLTTFMGMVERRAKHEPLAYIRGKSEFYGREFLVNPHTLEPRPETETMVDELKLLVNNGKWKIINDKLTIIDVGTGSGCIAITSKLELPTAKVFATDIDDHCLQTARLNANRHKTGAVFHKGNLLEPVLNKMTTSKVQTKIVLANLPYVPEKYELNAAAKYEPNHAIFGGEDGLDLYRKMFTQIDNMSANNNSPCYIFTESLPFQHKELKNIAKKHAYSLQKTNDFIQLFMKT